MATATLRVATNAPQVTTPAAAPSRWKAWLEPLKVAGTFCLIVTLWWLWNSPSVGEWLDLVT